MVTPKRGAFAALTVDPMHIELERHHPSVISTAVNLEQPEAFLEALRLSLGT